MIGVLRTGEGPAETAPTEGTERMADLVAYLEGAGVQASLAMEGYDRTVVPAFIDVALYGIAREAVTNIVRHAGASEAFVELAADGAAGCARLVVEDDGRGLAGADVSGDHHGLLGMRERARLLHGAFVAAERAQGGTRIEVSIPLAQKEEPHDRSHG